MKFPTTEEMAKEVAEKAFDEYEYKGKTMRQWMEEILYLEEKTSDKWIPCSERLPNHSESTDVFVTYIDRLTGKKWVDKECYFYGVWVATLNEFETRLAWMPLPEAYKGEE